MAHFYVLTSRSNEFLRHLSTQIQSQVLSFFKLRFPGDFALLHVMSSVVLVTVLYYLLTFLRGLGCVAERVVDNVGVWCIV